MNINLTLIVQMIVFAVLICVTMKCDLAAYPRCRWTSAQRKIAQGLAAAEKGEQALARGARATRTSSCARRASAPTRSSTRRSTAPTSWWRRPRAPRTTKARASWRPRTQQIELDTTRARESLRREVAGIAVGAASKLLGREIDARKHADLLDQLADADLSASPWRTSSPSPDPTRAPPSRRRAATERLAPWSDGAEGGGAGGAGSARRQPARQSARDARGACAARDRHRGPEARRARRELRAHARRQPPPRLPAARSPRCSTA